MLARIATAGATVATLTVLLVLAVIITFTVVMVPGMQQRVADGRAQIASVPGLHPKLLDAYQQAADHAPDRCALRWQILAGVAQIESNQAVGSTIDEDGNVEPKIIGPALDGTGSGGNTTAISDTDNGRWDGDQTWDRAVGVLQFIPTSWTAYTSGTYNGDGNGDGKADPHNVYDNAQAAMNHLCARGGRFDDDNSTAAALFRYNQSQTYVAVVSEAITRFDKTPVTSTSGDAAEPGGELQGACDVDLDLPSPNPRSCVEAVDYAMQMIHQDCIWYRMCLGATAVQYGWAVSGVYSAVDMWHQLNSLGYSHPGDREPPVGALLFWEGGTWGHVAIYVGGGKIVSNDIARSGCMDIAAWNAPEVQWGQTYLGWTPPYYPNGAGSA